MKVQADKRRQDVEFAVGDQVLVKLQPYRQHSVALRKNQKLAMRYFGPFEVLQRVGKVAYKLSLPSQAKIHSVFHVSQLKKFFGEKSLPYLPLPLLTNDTGAVLQPKEVLQTRVIVKGDSQVNQVLVLWDDDDIDAATWEDLEDIKKHHPLFNLEDKIAAKGDGIVTSETRQLQGRANAEAPRNDATRVSTRARVPSTRLHGYLT